MGRPAHTRAGFKARGGSAQRGVVRESARLTCTDTGAPVPAGVTPLLLQWRSDRLRVQIFSAGRQAGRLKFQFSQKIARPVQNFPKGENWIVNRPACCLLKKSGPSTYLHATVRRPRPTLLQQHRGSTQRLCGEDRGWYKFPLLIKFG